jgi:hypothetical protein
MDAPRFDALARALAVRTSRRRALAGGAAGVTAVALGRAGAQDATPAGEATPVSLPGFGQEFLFVQTATSGSFRPNPTAGTPVVDGTPAPGGGAQFLLTLEGHSGQTIYFSDRPQRIFGEAPTDRFIDGLGFSPANPPNAALVADTAEQGDDVLIVELVDPVYDETNGTLTYGANVLAEYQGDGLAHLAQQQADTELPEEFGRASLFIDDCPNTGIYCLSSLLPSCKVVSVVGTGTCWHWECLCCTLCSGSPLDICNQYVPECANGNCYAFTEEEFRHECLGIP